MSRAIDRHRLKKGLRSLSEDLDAYVVGDAETTRAATGAISELLKKAGDLGAGIQAKKEGEKTAKDKAAAEDAARKARDAAEAAKLLAQNEANPSGPLHQAALRAEQEARAAEAKAGIAIPQGGFKEVARPFPVRSTVGGALVGVAVGGLVGALVSSSRASGGAVGALLGGVGGAGVGFLIGK